MKKPASRTEYVIEKSCGAVLYKLEGGAPLYALVKGSVYGFPKGHVESDETEEQTAVREIKEETGVTAQLDMSFRREVVYRSPHFKNGRKRVVFFLARCPEGQTPQARHEIKDLVLAPYETALELLRISNLKRVLTDAHAYILEKEGL